MWRFIRAFGDNWKEWTVWRQLHIDNCIDFFSQCNKNAFNGIGFKMNTYILTCTQTTYTNVYILNLLYKVELWSVCLWLGSGLASLTWPSGSLESGCGCTREGHWLHQRPQDKPAITAHTREGALACQQLPPALSTLNYNKLVDL